MIFEQVYRDSKSLITFGGQNSVPPLRRSPRRDLRSCLLCFDVCQPVSRHVAQKQPQHTPLLGKQLVKREGTLDTSKDLQDVGGTEGIMRSKVKGKNARPKPIGNRA